MQGGPSNSIDPDSTIPITDTEVDLLIRTLVWINESVRIMNHARGVPVTVLVRTGPQLTTTLPFCHKSMQIDFLNILIFAIVNIKSTMYKTCLSLFPSWKHQTNFKGF